MKKMSSRQLLQCSLAILLALVELISTAPTTSPDQIMSATTASQNTPPDCTCWQSPSNCTTLEDAIQSMYDRIDEDGDEPYSFFTLKDLYYSGLLSTSSDLAPPPLDVDFTDPHEVALEERRCRYLLKNFPRTHSDERCSWTVQCEQKQDRFPSFYVEAVLDEGLSVAECKPLNIYNKRFVRTVCEQDSSKPHWQECDCGELTIGFKFIP